MYVTHTSFIIVPKLHSYSTKHALFRVPSIPTLALANSSQDLICTRVLDSSSCGPWQFRPSPPCKRVMTRLGPFTLVPMWSGRLCLPGKSFRGFPFCSRCGKTRSGHENKNVTHKNTQPLGRATKNNTKSCRKGWSSLVTIAVSGKITKQTNSDYSISFI
jgi:hypothetical protein